MIQRLLFLSYGIISVVITDRIPHSDQVLIGKTAVSCLLPVSAVAIFHSHSLTSHCELNRLQPQNILSTAASGRRIKAAFIPPSASSNVSQQIRRFIYISVCSCPYFIWALTVYALAELRRERTAVFA
ncbi:hypothetical protein CesoFtcFv8_004271 [Champsocephalus esox]|uniref:Vomeronasal type-1 receptor n=1 Tax=Champsocephalus esox TaxID=159716 RepID=A0AAN8CZV5_9TELE|nr:hypothetical protein CesoFtcFv8_004271 [Champsocephalus esox]